MKRPSLVEVAVCLVVLLVVGTVLAVPYCHAGTLQTLYFTVPILETQGQCVPQQDNYQEDLDSVTVVLQADQTWRKFYLQLDNVPRGVRQTVKGWSLPGGTWIVTTKVIEKSGGVDLVSCWGNRINVISFGF